MRSLNKQAVDHTVDQSDTVSELVHDTGGIARRHRAKSRPNQRRPHSIKKQSVERLLMDNPSPDSKMTGRRQLAEEFRNMAIVDTRPVLASVVQFVSECSRKASFESYRDIVCRADASAMRALACDPDLQARLAETGVDPSVVVRRYRYAVALEAAVEATLHEIATRTSSAGPEPIKHAARAIADLLIGYDDRDPASLANSIQNVFRRYGCTAVSDGFPDRILAIAKDVFPIGGSLYIDRERWHFDTDPDDTNNPWRRRCTAESYMASLEVLRLNGASLPAVGSEHWEFIVHLVHRLTSATSANTPGYPDDPALRSFIDSGNAFFSNQVGNEGYAMVLLQALQPAEYYDPVFACVYAARAVVTDDAAWILQGRREDAKRRLFAGVNLPRFLAQALSIDVSALIAAIESAEPSFTIETSWDHISRELFYPPYDVDCEAWCDLVYEPGQTKDFHVRHLATGLTEPLVEAMDRRYHRSKEHAGDSR